MKKWKTLPILLLILSVLTALLLIPGLNEYKAALADSEQSLGNAVQIPLRLVTFFITAPVLLLLVLLLYKPSGNRKRENSMREYRFR